MLLKSRCGNQTLESAKDLKGSVETAPAALKNQAEEAAKKSVTKEINKLTPEEAAKALKH